MKKFTKFSFCLLALIFLSVNIQAQTWIIMESDNSITYFGNGWMKSVEVEEEGDLSFIYNPSNDVIMVIDNINTSYAKGSSDDFCNAMISLRDEMNKQLPPEQVKMMQEMINQEKSKPAPEVTVTKEKGEVIAGYMTSKYTINVNGELYEEKWITMDPSLSSIIKLTKDVEKLISKTTTCAQPEGWPLNSLPESSEEYKKIELSGIELKSVKYEYGSPEIGTDVSSLQRENIPNSEFEVPKDYEDIGFKELLMSMSEM